MFLVTLTYLTDLKNIDQYLKAHRDYLDKHYALGHFLASGPQVPRTGGVVMASVDSREALDVILVEDPFNIHGMASYSITEFTPIKTSPELAFLKQG